MKPYTVILLYPDEVSAYPGESYTATVEAATARDAVTLAKDEASEGNLGAIGPEDFILLMVFDGILLPNDEDWT